MIRYLLLILLSAASLQAELKVLAFAGSTRQDSCNKKLIKEAALIAAESGATITCIDLKNLPMPLYDGDLEKSSGMPCNAKILRNLMLEHQIIIISSPEYNHSIPGGLKNALDWASRNEDGKASRDAFQGKLFILMSASGGKKGGAKGLSHLREVIGDMKGYTFPQEFCLPRASSAFNEDGKLKNPDIAAELRQFVQKALDL